MQIQSKHINRSTNETPFSSKHYQAGTLFKMFNIFQIFFAAVLSVAVSRDFEILLHKETAVENDNVQLHRILRSVEPSSFIADDSVNNLLHKMRTRRSTDEECKKLTLCKLHANSQRSFVGAFKLYFVNKENARLWDHRTHGKADCERLFAGCYASEPAASATPPQRRRNFRRDYDYFNY